MRMGTWSLDHAVALRDAGVDVRVVSLTPSFPKLAKSLVSGLGSYTDCPATAELSGIEVSYPRWWCYPIKQAWPWVGRAPGTFLSMGWRSARRRLMPIVDDWKPNVILANHSCVNGFVASRIGAQRGIPFVTVDHEVGDFLVCRDNPRWLGVMQRVSEAAAAQVTVSRSMQSVAEDVLPEGKFQTIYNGAGFDTCPDSELDRHVDKPDPVIFSCGNLYGRKDIPLLVRGFDALSDEFPEARLRIAGDGPDRDAIESLVESLPSRSRITLLGSIPHAEVQAEMRSADVFALVGWAEPFGVVFLEAMANGCPVVVSRDAGVAEILDDGDHALFTEPQDLDSVVTALRRLCRSHEMRRSIAMAGHQLFRDSCRWTHRATQYVDVLQSVISSHSSEPE